MKAYPLKLTPAVKDFIWGGDQLIKHWNKQNESGIIAESWEMSCHPEGESVVANGALAGKSLREVLQAYPQFLGGKGSQFEQFPILVKLIDAKTNLSIQVHPDDAYAKQHENQLGKTEMWYVLDAEPGAGVYCGFKEKIGRHELESYLREGTILEALNFLPVQKGDTVFIPARTVHAICGGVRIFEIQQNSSVTYRLFDYFRTDANGNPRALHIEKGLDVSDTDAISKVNQSVIKIGPQIKQLASCKYFSCYELQVEEEAEWETGTSSFVGLTLVEGEGSVRSEDDVLPMQKGETCFLPAGIGKIQLQGSCKWILYHI